MHGRGECLICAEENVLVNQRGCCGKQTCHDCTYRHIRSIFEESRTGGRRKILCPLGCGKEVVDSEIRLCLRQQHHSIAWDFIGYMLYILVLGWYVPSGSQAPVCRHFYYWMLFRHTRGERRDLQTYERWNVLTAYAEMTSQQAAELMHCPSADCDYSWIVANPAYRKRKRQHEDKPYWLWYEPLAPEPVPASWFEPDFLNIEVTGWIPRDIEERGNDGRRMVCGKCAHVFCALCRNPWVHERHRHSGISCRNFAKRFPRGWNGHDMVSWRSTRACPGCHMRTSRIDGCNHMTCPCGYEWCYICETSWNPIHYRCVEGQSTCVIL